MKRISKYRVEKVLVAKRLSKSLFFLLFTQHFSSLSAVMSMCGYATKQLIFDEVYS